MGINPITLHHKYTWLTSRNKGNMQLIGDLYFFPYNQIKPQGQIREGNDGQFYRSLFVFESQK